MEIYVFIITSFEDCQRNQEFREIESHRVQLDVQVVADEVDVV
jgi:hypothetical protein